MMRGLSLWEPWASAMAAGFKTIETRHWSTPYRGDLLICAAKKLINTEALGLPKELRFMRLHHGCAVCVVELFDCIPVENKPVGGLEEALGDYSAGRFAWLTRNLRPLKPPLRWWGKQSIWSLLPEQEQKIRSLL